MTYVIAEPCRDILDKACLDVCPVDCIYEGETMVFINPDECIDCAACEPACPVEAIYPDNELPEHWAAYEAANATFFDGFTGSQAGQSTPPRPDPDLPPRPAARDS